MKLLLRRIYKASNYTIGKLYVDNEYFCDTLEDTVRDLPWSCENTEKGQSCKCEEKIYGKTAIPEGKYKIILSMSNRFKKILPEILKVPHFLGIRIHSGNTENDTEGCILVGENTTKGKVLNSRNTMEKLMKKLNKDKHNLVIEII